VRRLIELGEEPIGFDDMFNEMHDMVGARSDGRFTLRELERSGLGVQLIDALVNIRKLVAWEALASQKAAGRPTHLRETREWDLFVERNYTRLVDAEDDVEPDEGAGGSAGEERDGGFVDEVQGMEDLTV